eukprot:2410875-Karenia_brevis.AAC.1
MQELLADGFSQAEIGRKLSLEHNVTVTRVYISRYLKTLSAQSTSHPSKTVVTSVTESTAQSSKTQAKEASSRTLTPTTLAAEFGDFVRERYLQGDSQADITRKLLEEHGVSARQ